MCLEHGWMGEAKEQIFADTVRSPIQYLGHSCSVPPRSNAFSCCAWNPDCHLWNYKTRTSEAGKLSPLTCLLITLAMEFSMKVLISHHNFTYSGLFERIHLQSHMPHSRVIVNWSMQALWMLLLAYLMRQVWDFNVGFFLLHIFLQISGIL